MLNVPPAILLRFLLEHRSEWADSSIDAYSAAAVKVGPCILPRARAGSFGGQVILPLAHTIEHEELLEVIKLEGVGHYPEDAIMPRDMFLLQEALKKRHEESLEPKAIPLTQEQLSIEILGKKSGYLKGFGVSPKPSSSRSSVTAQAHTEVVSSLQKELESLKNCPRSSKNKLDYSSEESY
ncbi:unnamed protein product [Camellia sinensis]